MNYSVSKNNITLLNSLVTFCGTQYWSRISLPYPTILFFLLKFNFWCLLNRLNVVRGRPLLVYGEDDVVYCGVFNKQL